VTSKLETNSFLHNRPNRRTVTAFFGFACVAPGLSGCARWETYRYKLTLAVDTPQGVRSAYNVVEVTTTAISVPAQGEYPTVKGEALYLDINGKPLIALLIKKRHSLSPPAAGQRLSSAPGGHPWWADWEYDSPTHMLDWLYSPDHPHNSYLDAIGSFGSSRDARALATTQLPDLVTFADVNDPKSVAPVDPDNLEASFGPGVKWSARTIAITADPLTTGLSDKLPWIRTMRGNQFLDGSTLHHNPPPTFANTLQPTDFIHRVSV